MEKSINGMTDDDKGNPGPVQYQDDYHDLAFQHTAYTVCSLSCAGNLHQSPAEPPVSPCPQRQPACRHSAGIVIQVTQLPCGRPIIWLRVHYPGIMSMYKYYFVFMLALLAIEANADSSTLDAAIGGGLGGAAGAAIGNEVGGRDGAIIGGALGGAVGAAVSTDEEPPHNDGHEPVYYRSSQPLYERPGYHFCPPGQAKKGRC
jgi:hypothetical protein